MAVPDPDRCPTFRCGPARSDADGATEAHDDPAEVHDRPGGVRGDLGVVPSLRHRPLHGHALAGHPCGSFYH